MIYLLDVCVLLAMGYSKHVHHARTDSWFNDVVGRGMPFSFATCSISECGFVRVASNKRFGFSEDVEGARHDLRQLKAKARFIFLDDNHDVERLPDWVRRSKQVTDGHLLALATAWGASFVTLDEGIPGAALIPEYPEIPYMVREPYIPYGPVKREADWMLNRNAAASNASSLRVPPRRSKAALAV